MKYTREERQAIMDGLKNGGAIQTLEAHAEVVAIVAPIVVAALIADGAIRRRDAEYASEYYVTANRLAMMIRASVHPDETCADYSASELSVPASKPPKSELPETETTEATPLEGGNGIEMTTADALAGQYCLRENMLAHSTAFLISEGFKPSDDFDGTRHETLANALDNIKHDQQARLVEWAEAAAAEGVDV